MFININQPIVDDLIRVKYSRSETVENLDDVQHDLVRAALRHLGITRAIEIVSMADVPSGTGLGSSSSYLIGLLHGLHVLKRQYVPLQDLAEEACHIELDVLGKPIGKHDQYMAVYGGLTVLDIEKDGAVHVRNAHLSQSTIDEMERNMLLFFTGISRNSMDILTGLTKATERNDMTVVESLHKIKEIGYKVLEALEDGNLRNFGLLLDQHWQTKKNLSPKVSNSTINELYEIAKRNGAIGGKLMGAGGGGFFMFYVEKDHHKLRSAMSGCGLREMRYRFDFEGTKVIANFLNYRVDSD
jgi:D-glycero-alpha-D-manno-heptose-7-phosphate kinase